MNIFRKIIDRQIPADIVYEDDKAIAFRDKGRMKQVLDAAARHRKA